MAAVMWHGSSKHVIGWCIAKLHARHAHRPRTLSPAPLLQAGIVAQGGLLPLLDLLETCQSNLQVRQGAGCAG